MENIEKNAIIRQSDLLNIVIRSPYFPKGKGFSGFLHI